MVSLFGSAKMSRWVLVVPHHPSVTVTAHATKKTEEILLNPPAYVTSDFEVMVRDLQTFPEDHYNGVMTRKQVISLPEPNLTDTEIDDWISSAQGVWIENLKLTIEKRIGGRSQFTLENQIRNSAKSLLAKGNLLDSLRTASPLAYESVIKLILRRKEVLETYGPFGWQTKYL